MADPIAHRVAARFIAASKPHDYDAPHKLEALRSARRKAFHSFAAWADSHPHASEAEVAREYEKVNAAADAYSKAYKAWLEAHDF